MKLKKLGVLSLFALVAGMGLASCTPDNSVGPTTEGGSGFVKEKTEITIWTTIGKNNQPVWESIIEGFQKLEPNVTINNVYESSSYNVMAEKASNGFATGEYPDLIQCYPDAVSDFMSYGKAVNLDKYKNDRKMVKGSSLIADPSTYEGEYEADKEYCIGWTEEDEADIVPAYLAEGRDYVMEGTYSVPFSKSTEAMFYNKAIEGVSIEGINGGKPIDANYINNLSWEELFGNFCPKFLAWNKEQGDKAILKDDQDYHGVIAYDSDDNLFITLGEQYGLDYTVADKETGKGKALFNNDAYKEKMMEWHDYANAGYVISKGSANNNYTNTYFTANNLLFSIGSTGGVKYQFSSSNPMDVGVARVPQAQAAIDGTNPKAKLAQINQGPSLAMLDHGSENRELASWLFYKYVSNYENSLKWAIDSGYAPIRLSAAESDDYKEYANELLVDLKTLDRVMARTNAFVPTVANILYTSPSFTGSAQCRTSAGAIATKALTKGELTREELDAFFNEQLTVCNTKIG